ncbi:MAG: S-layer homology domain-containing protein [Clostridiales bacterium]|jgi:hypothetical protein|nr:S-layer homology domain-containing protein [Clostridiales bacterium]
MNSLKKATSLLLAFVMIIGLVPAFAASYTDVSEADNEAVTVLSAFDILQGYEDGTFGGDKAITRAEFAAVVDRLIGAEDLSKVQVATIFSDVPQSHWASGYIQMAQQQGIIVGYPDGTFLPEQTVTYEEAVKMLICALGYEPMAVDEGGYPTGYLYSAQLAGVTKGTTGVIGQPATRSLVAQLTYRALTADMMERVIYGTGDKNYQVVAGQKVLGKYLNAAKVRVAVKETPISQPSNYKNQVQVGIKDAYGQIDSPAYKAVGTQDYYINGTNIVDYFGKTAIVYITFVPNSTEDPTIVAVLDDPKTSETVVLASDLIKITNDAMSPVRTEKLTFFTDKFAEAEDSFIVKNDVDVYVNGVEVPSFPNLYVDGASGDPEGIDTLMGYKDAKLTFVKTADDAKEYDYDYDTIYVEDYKTLIVNRVNTSTKTITGKTSVSGVDFFNLATTLSYDPDSKIELTLVDASGAAVKPEDLKEGDVITYTDSGVTASKTYIKGVVGSTVLSDVRVDDYNNNVYQIGEGYYKTNGITTKISVGDAGDFTLNNNGVIVAFEEGDEDIGTYAVVQEFPGTTATLFTVDGGSVTYDLASKVRLNGSSVTRGALALTAGDLIAYKLNDDGDIATVNVAADYDSEAGTPLDTMVQGVAEDYDADDKEIKATFFSDGSLKSYDLAEDAPIFVATTKQDGNYVADGDYKVLSFKDLVDNQELDADSIVTTVAMNDKDEDTIAAAVVMPDAAPFILKDSNAEMVVITGMDKPAPYGSNVDDVTRVKYRTLENPGTQVDAYTANKTATDLTGEAVNYTDLAINTVATLVFDANGAITDIYPISQLGNDASSAPALESGLSKIETAGDNVVSYELMQIGVDTDARSNVVYEKFTLADLDDDTTTLNGTYKFADLANAKLFVIDPTLTLSQRYADAVDTSFLVTSTGNNYGYAVVKFYDEKPQQIIVLDTNDDTSLVVVD